MIHEIESLLKAYQDGQDAVRRKPYYAPSNPFCEEDEYEHDLYRAWEDGAESAGLFGPFSIYTNGVLNEGER